MGPSVESVALRPGGRWERHRLLAASTFVTCHLAPALLATGAGVLLSGVLDRPGGIGAASWWVTIVAAGLLVFMGVRSLLQRPLVMSGLLDIEAAFPATPPPRVLVAWHSSSAAEVQRIVWEASSSEWSPASQTRRVAFTAALQVLDRQRRHAEVIFRIGSRNLSARVAESDLPGFLQILPMRSAQRRRTMIAIACTGTLTLLTTAALATSVSPHGTRPSAAGSKPVPHTFGSGSSTTAPGSAPGASTPGQADAVNPVGPSPPRPDIPRSEPVAVAASADDHTAEEQIQPASSPRTTPTSESARESAASSQVPANGDMPTQTSSAATRTSLVTGPERPPGATSDAQPASGSDAQPASVTPRDTTASDPEPPASVTPHRDTTTSDAQPPKGARLAAKHHEGGECARPEPTEQPVHERTEQSRRHEEDRRDPTAAK
jgi:hypothetical protein